VAVLEQPATLERLRALEQVLGKDGLERAFEIATASPDDGPWKRFLGTILLWLGLLQVLAGVVFFFAYNWAKLHRFSKLGLLLGALLACALAAQWLGFRKRAGQAALAAAVILVGPLLAVYGQAYQTGADPYELFLGWTLLVVPWVVLARLPALWVLVVVLANTALFLFFAQVADNAKIGEIFGSAGMLNGLAWLAWELRGRRVEGWESSRWVPRLFAAATFGCLTIPDLALVLEKHHVENASLASLAATALLVAAVFVIYRKRLDLFMLAAALGTVMTVFTSWVARFLVKSSDAFGVFLVGFLVIAEVAMAASYLRKVGRGHEAES
jgi:uncharacterized membrane protein